MEFLTSFYNTGMAMVEIFIIVMCGFFFVKLKLFDAEGVKGIISLTINLFLPCLIFAHFMEHAKDALPADWWVYPLLGILVSAAGFLVAGIFSFFHKDRQLRGEFASLIAFQNCGYLPLMLVAAVFPEEIKRVLFVYIFLFIQGFNFIFWGFGVHFLIGTEKRKMEIKKIFNPPFVSLLLCLFLVKTKFYVFLPVPLFRAVKIVGVCTLPVALISLGAVLAQCLVPLHNVSKRFLAEVVLLKLVVMPILAMALLFFWRIHPLAALLIMIEASMPAAINLGMVSFHYSGKCNLVSQAVLLTHFFALFTVPFFLSLYLSFVQK
ncbi:MAG: AEC family transporter [Candidatus Omnitrophica bacterium]|nr:AEC family transporter [Candidatus Omnitrophota bacterium]MBU4478312.1 AEC family transporter [Candidatus Omnitrophota bacterium]MCG2703449.1 AEC family transporter [Candidatus Omnitrophota bacterium]